MSEAAIFIANEMQNRTGRKEFMGAIDAQLDQWKTALREGKSFKPNLNLDTLAKTMGRETVAAQSVSPDVARRGEMLRSRSGREPSVRD